MGVPLEMTIEDSPDSVRAGPSGEGGDVLLQRRGETLDALQHIVNTAFRRELEGDRSFVVDCLDYRRGKDAELQQMARFMHGEGQEVRRAAGNGAAQSVCPPPRAHYRRRGSPDDVGEHRGRVSEDRHHFAAALRIDSGLRLEIRPDVRLRIA